MKQILQGLLPISILLTNCIDTAYAQSEVSKSISYTSSEGYYYYISINGKAHPTYVKWEIKRNARALQLQGCTFSSNSVFAEKNDTISIDEYLTTYEDHCLDPQYTSSLTIKIVDYSTGKIYKETLTISSDPIKWTTLPAKATSNTVAVLATTTNIDDDGAVTGFEWRQYNAPDSVPSAQSECPVIDGELVGALKNLSANTYYKFRPYYTSAAGIIDYGEWSAFGTADAYVYFDPTVKTYSASDITESSARIRGYVIQGSDNIIKQGFEYWVVKQSSRALRSTETDDVTVVEVDDTTTRLSTVLTGLQAGTTYAYRVFATTEKGIVYGEERTFTTAVSMGINGMTMDAETAAPTIIGYYDLQGRKLSEKIKGVNIIRYSDGTTRKVYVK